MGDSRECLGEPVLEIDSVEFASLDERGDHGPVLGADVMASEERILAVQGNGADGALDDVVIHLNLTVFKILGQAVPMFGNIVERLSERGKRWTCIGNTPKKSSCGSLCVLCESCASVTPVESRCQIPGSGQQKTQQIRILTGFLLVAGVGFTVGRVAFSVASKPLFHKGSPSEPVGSFTHTAPQLKNPHHTRWRGFSTGCGGLQPPRVFKFRY